MRLPKLLKGSYTNNRAGIKRMSTIVVEGHGQSRERPRSCSPKDPCLRTLFGDTTTQITVGMRHEADARSNTEPNLTTTASALSCFGGLLCIGQEKKRKTIYNAALTEVSTSI